MDTRDVERELVAALHRRAEDAMTRTDPQAEHRTFQSVVADHPRKVRRSWLVAGAAAAVVALVAAVVLWPSDQDLEGSNLPAVEAPATTKAADLAAAEAVAAAWTAHDTDLLAPYLDPEMSPKASEWSRELDRDAAYGVEYLMEPCQDVSPSTAETLFTFSCPFRMHLLGSREVGKGPFPDNEMLVDVRDGKVVSAENIKSWQTNGIAPHFDSVHEWVDANHPKDAKFLRIDEQKVTAADWPRWSRLWKQYIAEYVAATNEAA